MEINILCKNVVMHCLYVLTWATSFKINILVLALVSFVIFCLRATLG